MRPEYQIHLPCTWVTHERSRDDGDTISVTCISGFLWRIRLKDINCPELNTKDGIDSKHFVESLLEMNKGTLSSVFMIPRKVIKAVREGSRINPLNLTSFNRVVGDIILDDEGRKLTDVIVAHGYGRRV